MSFVSQRKQQFTLEITTTALCNLACTYCFEGEKTDKRRLDGKVDLVKQRTRELIDSDWFKEHYDSLNISFWGGEPTLNGPLIIDVINEFSSRDNVEFHIYTNAYDRRRIDQIVDSVDTTNLHIQISYDGKPINDKFRLTSTGKSSSAQVIENIEYFARKGISVSLKSTVPTDSMVGLYDTWLDFKRLHDHLSGIGPNIHVSYAPTIDYASDIPSDDLQSMIAAFRQEILRIAAEEVKFVKKHGYHLMSWFNGSEAKFHCASGAHMHTIDVDGQTYACHGSLYSPNKEQMRGSDIHNDSFVDDVSRMSGEYKNHIQTISPVCEGCVATTCMICPVTSLDKSKNESFTDRWTDRWVNSMCGFFKTFGEIDRTIQALLDGELNTPTEGEQ